ncbi:MAG: MFS transporter, partial [Alphaproteobacteria bacterium]|nr:MFS transporter [Alphaproteobacteria bacterium]
MTPADEAVVGPGAPPENEVSKIVGLIAAGHFFSHFYLLSLPPLFLFIQKEFSVSFVALGLAMTAYNLIGGVIQAPVGFLVDRFGARHLLLLGFALNVVAVGLIGFVDAYWILLVLAVLAGIGNSVFHPADYAILSGAVPEKKVGRAFGFHTFAGFFGGAVAPITMGVLASLWGWRTALIAASAAGLATLIVMALNGRALDRAAPGRGPRREAPRKDGPKRGLSLLVAPAMLVFFGLFCAITFTTGGINAFTISGLIELQESTYAAANAALTGFLMASAFGVLLGGFLADRFGRHDLVATVALIIAAAAFVLPALMPMSAPVLIAVLTLSGLAFGTVQPARDMMVRAITPSGEMGKVFGFLSVGMSVGASASPLVFGWFLDAGRPDWVFFGAAFFML